MQTKTLKPRRLFFLDGIGAFVSLIFLGIVLVRYQELIGMPIPALRILAIFPFLFMIYDTICYFKAKSQPAVLLKVISVLNLLYAFFSITSVFFYFDKITYLGLNYFSLEVILILLLVNLEWKTATSLEADKALSDYLKQHDQG